LFSRISSDVTSKCLVEISPDCIPGTGGRKGHRSFGERVCFSVELPDAFGLPARAGRLRRSKSYT
jgi:hypothetical protein